MGEQASGTVETWWQLSHIELLAAYHDARRRFTEKKFARDTQLARLEWLRARALTAGTGGVTEQKSAIDASEELARKGREMREMTRDLIKIDVDLIAMIARLHGAADAKAEESADGDDGTERQHEGR
jgi:hypothetical protein